MEKRLFVWVGKKTNFIYVTIGCDAAMQKKSNSEFNVLYMSISNGVEGCRL